MDRMEDVCARACLLTRAAWEPDMPPLLTRRDVHALLGEGMLHGLVLQHDDRLPDEKRSRIRCLLSRARAVYELCRAYEEKGYSVILPDDDDWPKRLNNLGNKAPLFLFALGNRALLGNRMAAVAGSRDILPDTNAAAMELGRRLAQERVTLVSGGARGVDQAVQEGVLCEGGCAVVVPAMPDYVIMDLPYVKEALEEGRLLILCDALPDSPFTAEKALSRNHTIYALGEAAVVTAARDGVGGSWKGAADCLKGGWTPVFVLEGEGADQAGCRALEALGAVCFSMEKTASLSSILFACRQTSLFD